MGEFFLSSFSLFLFLTGTIPCPGYFTSPASLFRIHSCYNMFLINFRMKLPTAHLKFSVQLSCSAITHFEEFNWTKCQIQISLMAPGHSSSHTGKKNAFKGKNLPLAKVGRLKKNGVLKPSLKLYSEIQPGEGCFARINHFEIGSSMADAWNYTKSTYIDVLIGSR